MALSSGGNSDDVAFLSRAEIGGWGGQADGIVQFAKNKEKDENPYP